jgi:hypothetical protein
MSAQPANPHFLVLEKYALSKVKARQAVVAVLQRCDVQRPKEGWEALRLTWKDESPPASVNFSNLVDEARGTGVVQRLQEYLDKKDSVFGGTFGDMSTPNFQIRCKSAYAGWEKEAQGPCRTSCVERDLMEDILEFRRQACEYSNEYDFRVTARFFRVYLSACVSLLDAFINRHVLLARHEGFTSPEFTRLQAETNMEEKVRLWWAVCSDGDPSLFFRSAMWCHFQEIRTRRNEILHAVDPISVYSLKDIQVYLNKVRTGVGELLLSLRQAHKKPTLGFIERLRTAPTVAFRQIRFRADGEHDIKVIQG